MSGLRYIPVLGAAATGILAAVAISQDLALLSDVRAKDVRVVSARGAADLGTCVWHPPKASADAHLGGYWRRDDASRCAEKPDNYREMMAFGLHGARWMLQNRTHLVDGARLPALQRTYEVAKYATLGRQNMMIRYSDVADGLGEVDLESVPSCAEIYQGVGAASAAPEDVQFASVVCDDATLVPAQDLAPVVGEDSLLRHLCEKQFSYGRSKVSQSALRLPDFREQYSPLVLLFEDEIGFNATGKWSQRSDVYVGQRFGMFMFYLVPACILNGILAVDSTFTVLWESTSALREAEKKRVQRTATRGNIVVMRDFMTVVKFKASMRVYAVVAWAVAAAGAVGGAALSFGIEGGQFPRPECTATGWLSDEDNVWKTYTSLILSAAGILAHPVALLFNQGFCWSRFGRNKTFEGTEARAGWAWQTLTFVSLGTLFVLAEASVMHVAYGVQWGRSKARGDTGFTTVKLCSILYDYATSLSVLALTCGALLGMVFNRWSLEGSSELFVGFFLLWSATAIALLYPLFAVDANAYAWRNIGDIVGGKDMDVGDGTDFCDGVGGWLYTYCKDVRPFAIYATTGVLVMATVTQVVLWAWRLTSLGACCAKTRYWANRAVSVPSRYRLKKKNLDFAAVAATPLQEKKPLLPVAAHTRVEDGSAVPSLVRLSHTQV